MKIAEQNLKLGGFPLDMMTEINPMPGVYVGEPTMTDHLEPSTELVWISTKPGEDGQHRRVPPTLPLEEFVLTAIQLSMVFFE